MAIKGVSDIRRLPRLGKIRLGEKGVSQKTGKEYPKALDYFLCPPEVQKVYGEKPRMLDIMFPVSDQSVFFPQFYKRYGTSTGLVCKGDGETATMHQDGEMIEIECVPDECDWYAKKHCRRLANLQFLLPRVPGLGVWQIDTTSFYSIININSGLAMIQAVADRIHMLPLQLILKPQEVSPDGKKKTVYVLDLVAPVTLAKLLNDSQTPARQLLMPSLDENDRPDDLYPDGVLNKEGPPPFNLDQKEDPEEDARQRELDRVAKESGLERQRQIDEIKAAAFSTPEEPEDIDNDLAVAWATLGTPLAKQKAILANPNLDKTALLKELQSEVKKRKEAAKPRPAPATTAAAPIAPPPGNGNGNTAPAQRQQSFF
ncbi:MAG: hypothetical protein WC364_04770 [Eubacteriales bacterium]